MNSRRIIAGIAALTVACTAFGEAVPVGVRPCQSAAAADLTVDDWIYESTGDGIKLVRYTGKKTEVTIPGQLGEEKVEEVSAHIFEECENDVEKLVLPSEDMGFDGNLLESSKVKEIVTPQFTFTRTDIGRKNTLSLSASIYADVWKNEQDEKQRSESIDVTVPEKVAGADVKIIRKSSFSNSVGINEIILPDTVSVIETYAFTASPIRRIVFPENVRIIPDWCFNGCNNLKEIVFPEGLVGIAPCAFQDTKYANEFEEYKGGSSSGREITAEVPDWSVKIVINDELVPVVRPLKYTGSDEIVDFPEEIGGLTAVYDTSTANSILPEYDTEKDITVREIRFPSGMKVMPCIGHSSLEKVVLPEAAEEIPNFFLESSKRLTEMTIPGNISKIGASSFKDCENLESVTIKSSSIELGSRAFMNTGIKALELPGNCILGKQCVSGKLESVSFGAGDSVVLDGAFSELSSLKEINFSPDIREIRLGVDALSGTSITSLEPGSSCKEIGASSVRRCPALKSVKISGDAAIGECAFIDDTALEEVALSGKHSIGSSAFADCTSLKSFDFDEEPVLSEDSFDGCRELRTINGIRVTEEGSTGFAEELDVFIRRSFAGADEVGFIDDYVMNNAEAVVAEVTDGSMSDIEKAKALHDWLCANSEYAPHEYEFAPENHVDSAVFMDGVAVCEGYARTYNLLLHAAGLESWFLDNDTNAWNIVMLGGRAFHIDTTWDDGTVPGYRWFMRSDEELRLAGGAHKKWDLTVPSYLHSFQSGKLPECRDVMGDTDGDGDLDTDDIMALRERLISGEKYDILADLDFNGKVSAGDLPAAIARTGSSLKMGDVDGDGIITSADASMLLEEYALMSVSSSKTFDAEKTLVSDVNVDGQINSADASSILGYYSYISTGGTDDICRYTEN